ncbi:MAG: hypothetical protein U0I51_09460 [Muricomes sp.]|nr:hypothetical protein [Muricomes sp.]CAJ1763091.1 hypothetical protein AUSP0088_00066 [uncultured phage]
MELYKARKDKMEFYIQPEMLEHYALAGYEIIKMEEKIIHDVKKEAALVENKNV